MTIPTRLKRPLPKPEISDLQRFGELVEDWASGNKPRPNSIPELKAQAEERGINIVIPDHMTEFVRVDADSNTVMLFIPSLDAINKCRDHLQEIPPEFEIYPVDDYFTDAFKCGEDDARILEYKNMSPAEREEFMMKRIGDYCMTVCM